MTPLNPKETLLQELYQNCSAFVTETTQEIHRLVRGNGGLKAKIVFVGHIPSEEEENEGKSFVNGIGEDFYDAIKASALEVQETYVTYLIKYKPYQINPETGRMVKRPVTKEEYAVFLDYLAQELAIIEPQLVVAMGEPVFKCLLKGVKKPFKPHLNQLMAISLGSKAYDVMPMVCPTSKNQDFVSAFDAIERFLQDPKKEVPQTVPAIKKRQYLPIKSPTGDQKKGQRIKVIIVNGASHFSDDPMHAALDRIAHVLTELNTNIIRMDLDKPYDMQAFLDHVPTADGVILATTVTWIGIGGRLQTFLDACYELAKPGLLDHTYLMGVVISRQMYERDAYHHMLRSYELLGGNEGVAICTAIKNVIALETNPTLLHAIEKKAESFYRILSQKQPSLPSSIRLNRRVFEIEIEKNEPITEGVLKEADQDKQSTLLPDYDVYIEKQKQDIEAITALFKHKLSQPAYEKEAHERFKAAYKGSDMKSIVLWQIEDRPHKSFTMRLEKEQIFCELKVTDAPMVTIQLKEEILERMLQGKLTIQRAFMTGLLKAKGDFSFIYQLDQIFDFKSI